MAFRFPIFAFALVLFFTPPALADELEAQAKQLIERALASSLSYEITESLTTEIGPRLGGSPAEARARDWAVDKFKALGFAPPTIEDFDMQGWERGHISIQVGAPFTQPLIGTALGKSVGTPVGGITAPMVYFENYAALIAADDDAIAGKIAFVDGTMVRTQDSSGYGAAGPRRWSGAYQAAKRGAVGILVRSVGTDPHRNPHTGGTTYGDDAPKIPAAALANPDADQLARLMALKSDLEVHFTQTSRLIGTVQSGNVIAEIPGSEFPDEVVLIAAHLDSWDNSPGVQDDGVGVGIVMAAAKIIKDFGQPKRTIRIVLFGAEEFGLYGARAYLQARQKDELFSHIMMVTQSDLGSGRIWRMDTGIAKTDEEKADRIHAVLAPLGVTRGKRTATGGSDVSILSGAGAPAISLIQDGSKYFDYHHTPNDTMDTIDRDDLKQNTAVYAAYAWMVANIEGGFHPPEK